MATIPPWLNVSPSDFLRAMQAGATAGLQVADLRQRGSLEGARLAQSAAEAAANRSAAAQAQANSLAFQEWERGELGRQAAEENARRERVAMAGLEQRGLESALGRQLDLARIGETGRHQRATEEIERGKLGLPLSPIARLQADRARAIEAGDTEAAGQLDAAIQQAASNRGRSIFVGTDAEGKPIFELTEGGAPSRIGDLGKMTTATATQAQQKLLKYENSAEILNYLQQRLRPEHIGAAGVVGELVLDRVLPQLGAQTANRGRIDVRTALSAAREGLLREISDDSRFSNLDRQEIAKSLPSSGVFESYEDAIQRIQTVRRILSSRGRVYAESLGIKPPGWAMPVPEIIKRYQDGVRSGLDPNSPDFKNQFLTEEEALSALERFY